MNQKTSLLLTQQTIRYLPSKRSFPDELSAFQQRVIIWNFQDLSKSIVPAGFQFKELDNCVLYFHFFHNDERKFSKILESIKVDDH